MPIVNIETLKIFKPEQRKEILQEINKVTAEAFQIPRAYCHVKWQQIQPDDYFCETNQPEKHIYIELKLFTGRSLDIKRKLYESIFNVFKKYNVEPDDLMIALVEIPMEDWGMRGGVPASELTFTYSVKI